MATINPLDIRADQIILGRDSEYRWKMGEEVKGIEKSPLSEGFDAALQMPYSELEQIVREKIQQYYGQGGGENGMSVIDDNESKKSTVLITEATLGGIREVLSKGLGK